MEKLDEQELDKLLQDISTIKSAIHQNKNILKDFLTPFHFRSIAWVWGLGVCVFSLIFQGLVQYFEGFGQIPLLIQLAMFGMIGGAMVWIMRWKQQILLKVVKQENPRATLTHAYKELYSFQIRHMYIPLVGVMILLFFLLFYWDLSYFVVPTIAIFSGLIFNFIACLGEIKQYLLAGYWFMVTGIAVLLFPQIPLFLAIALTLGGGSIVFAVSLQRRE